MTRINQLTRDRTVLTAILTPASTNGTRSHPEMVGDMSRATLNFDLSKILFVRFWPGSRSILTPKIKHVHLLVLIRERLQAPTTTTPETTVQPLGRHIANEPCKYLPLSRPHM